MVPPAIFSIGSPAFHCGYLSGDGQFGSVEVENKQLLLYSSICSFWSLAALPVLQYLLWAIKEACTGLLFKATRWQLKYAGCLVHAVTVEVLVRITISALQVSSKRVKIDELPLRAARQAVTLLVFAAIVQYITYKIKEVD